MPDPQVDPQSGRVRTGVAAPLVSSRQIDCSLRSHLQSFRCAELNAQYVANDDFLVVEDFLPKNLLEPAEREIEALRPHIHRSYLPGRKKSGSVDHDGVRDHAPVIHALYASPSLFDFLGRVTRAPLHYCPAHDLHRCALYAYTEAGDHIAWHYDTSFYRGRRFTVLLPLRDGSSSRLLYRLHTRDAANPSSEGALETRPGSLIVFDGDKLYHAVSPLGENEQRFLVTMEFVTNPSMSWPLRVLSDIKDTFAYFGVRRMFGR